MYLQFGGMSRTRTRRSLTKPNYVEHGSSASEPESESDSGPIVDVLVESQDSVETKQARLKSHGRLGRLARDEQTSSGEKIYDQLSGSGTAIKLVVDEWTMLWDDSPETAALQLVNFVLLTSSIRQPMTRADLEHPDPAAVLAELQETWTSTGSEYLLSSKLKTKPAKSMKLNFAEFWGRWSNVVLIEDASRLVISWLMTMSSSGYRPLRHAASLACFNILRGCAVHCSTLAKELDKVSRLKSSGMVDSISSQLALLEKTIQMIFDGVFLQRFRDVDFNIRIEAVTNLEKWIESYPEVFLDNSYLRYIGWALSDRISAVRCTSLEVFSVLYRDGSMRDGMDSFTQRFLPRVLEMAERDVELAVRDEACLLVAELYRFCEDKGEFKENLGFLLDLVRFAQPITKSGLEALLTVIFDGESYESFRKKAELAVSQIKDPHADDHPEMLICCQIAKFADAVTDGIPVDRRLLCVEHFIGVAKRTIPALRDITLWVRLTEAVLLGKSFKSNVADRQQWESLFNNIASVNGFMMVLEAVTRYSFVYVNSMADSTRQMHCGLNKSNSRDLSNLLVSIVPNWMPEVVKQSGCLAAFLDLLGLADAVSLCAGWTDAVAAIGGIAVLCNNSATAESLVSLARYWQQEEITGAFTIFLKTIPEDSACCQRYARMALGKIPWSEVIRGGFWARLGAAAPFVPVPDWIRLSSALKDLVDKIYILLEDGKSLSLSDTPEEYITLESTVLPALLTALVKGSAFSESDEDFYSVLTGHFSQKTIHTGAHVLGLLCDLKDAKVDNDTEEEMIEFIEQVGATEEGLIPSLSLGKLFLNGAVSEKALVAVMTLYGHHYKGVVAQKCFLSLWNSTVSKVGDQTVDLISVIFGALGSDLENDLEGLALLSSLFADSLRDNPQARNSNSLVRLFISTIEAGKDGARLDALLTSLAVWLTPNLAAEVLTSYRRDVDRRPALASDTLTKALIKASTKRTVPARRRPVTGGSKLCKEVSDDEDLINSEAATPTKEFAGLKMSSELALPSSPLPARKRTIKMAANQKSDSIKLVAPLGGHGPRHPNRRVHHCRRGLSPCPPWAVVPVHTPGTREGPQAPEETTIALTLARRRFCCATSSAAPTQFTLF
ncbi:hypothetical protein PSACC_00074 [Paramicrosporidium saccamoebae]|uniref:SCD domain-containing protein n=1 Tax=Paramicrosporidium saccamoebae TaxID=1246581 RepID=A0A2H9TQU1_9FUNG|nr:hypothetical protein PSACC_00074 [Paramicrosporidium saccamoebae]